MATPFDFVGLAKQLKFETRELPTETRARLKRESEETTSLLRREEADAEHERQKDLILFKTVVGVVTAATFTCLLVTFLPWFTPDQKHWASTLLSTIVAGAFAYMTGKNSK